METDGSGPPTREHAPIQSRGGRLHRSNFLGPVLVSLAYYIGAEAAFIIGTLSDRIFAPFWPPNAVLFCAFISVPYRRWLIYVLAVFPAHVIAELGVGTNERAELTGNLLEDEKILGTVHVAFGASAAIGGTVNVPVHEDCVVVDPTLTIGGTTVVDAGRFVL